ncbi:MAG: hypothetical protein HUU01_05360 [Saprospiraceae bacterium]|nr:hypothetical protein [Saprospiraceae bacterium]
MSETGNYFYCSIDLTKEYSFETHLLLELSPTGEILKSERFFHSNYSCCLDNYYEGFSKLGDYFGLITCGTGSGYCAGYLYLFKEILPQDAQHSIPQWYWSSLGEQFQRFSSTMELKKDNLVVHYTVEDGELDEGSTRNIKETRKFDVRYGFKNNQWVTNDTAKFEGLDINW